jgi:hypothetical protein
VTPKKSTHTCVLLVFSHNETDTSTPMHGHKLQSKIVEVEEVKGTL